MPTLITTTNHWFIWVLVQKNSTIIHCDVCAGQKIVQDFNFLTHNNRISHQIKVNGHFFHKLSRLVYMLALVRVLCTECTPPHCYIRLSQWVNVIVYFCLCQIHISSCPSRELSLKSCVYLYELFAFFLSRALCLKHWTNEKKIEKKKEQIEWKKKKMLNIFVLLIIIQVIAATY